MAEYKDTAALAYYQEALDLQGGYMPALLGESQELPGVLQDPEQVHGQ